MAEDIEPAAGTSEAPAVEETFERVDFARVAKVAGRVHLLDVRLAAVEGQLSVMPSAVAPDWRSQAVLGFESEVVSAADDDQPLSVAAAFRCTYTPKVDPEGPPDDGSPAFHLEASFVLTYDVSDTEGLDKGDLAHFAFTNGTHNAWPYWRELVQSFTQRMGLPPLVVGPFKVPSKFDPPK